MVKHPLGEDPYVDFTDEQLLQELSNLRKRRPSSQKAIIAEATLLWAIVNQLETRGMIHVRD